MLKFLAVAVAVIVGASQAAAQPDPATGYPGRAVRIIVSAPPGGGVDIVARVLADRLTKLWGQPFVVENRPGAGGNAGSEAVAHAEPDGYTLLAAQPAPLTTNVLMYKKLNFDPAAFEPLAIMSLIPNTLVVRPDFPANSVQEFIAYAKANPGKVNFGSQGIGTTPHLTGELFARMTATTLTHVPYRGTAQAVNDLIAGHLDALFFQLDSVREQYQAEESQDARGHDRCARRIGAGGPDHGGSRREGLPLQHLECVDGAAEDAGCHHGSAQPGAQRAAQDAGDRRATARHEHDAGRRHTGRDQGVHRRGDRALGRGDPRGEYQAGLARYDFGRGAHTRHLRRGGVGEATQSSLADPPSASRDCSRHAIANRPSDI